MDKKIVMIIAPKMFRDEELLEPKGVFEDNGIEVTIASRGVREAVGKLGAVVDVDMDISEIDISDYDAIVFVGGPGASTYFNDDIALALAEKAFEKKKVIAAICIAPSILANAGLLQRKKATAFPSEEPNLRDKGAKYTGEELTQDKNIITANGPNAAQAFGLKIVKVLADI